MNQLKDQMETFKFEKEQMKIELQKMQNENHVFRANTKELWEYKKREREMSKPKNRNERN